MRKRNGPQKFIHKISFLENAAKQAIDKADWKEKLNSFAEVKPVCDNKFISLEGISFGNVIAEEYFLFNIRFVPGIHSNMRIKFREKIFEIKRIINEQERNRVLSIIALEI